jgi:hypothetical protein
MLVVLPFGTFLVQCSNNDGAGVTSSTNPNNPAPGGDTTPPDAPPRIEGDNIVYTSNQVNAHSHSFSIPSASFTSPAPAGISGATTSAQLHSHLVTVTQQTLASTAAGQSVKVETSNVAGHTHTFTFVRVG